MEPAPIATPIGLSARAHVAIAFAIRGAPQTVAVRVAITQRDNLTRFDLLSFDVPGLAIKTSPMTFVIDRHANTITAWNDAKRTYYTQSFLPRSLAGPSALPSPTPSPASTTRQRPERSLFADLDLLTLDMRLAGHSMVAGIASTGLKFDAKVRRHNALTVSHLTASVAVADDFAFFPVALQVQVQGTGTAAGPSLTYAVDSFTRDVSAASTFVVPDGYAVETSLLRVLIGSPPRRATPLASPSPMAAPTGAL